MVNAELSAHLGGRAAITSLRALVRTAVGTAVLWHQRACQRRHLLTLEDRLYSDIGVTAGDAYRESRKPFWRA